MRPNGRWKKCAECGCKIYVQPNQEARGEGKYCSRNCKHAFLRGRERSKGTRYVRKDGYVAVKVGIRKYHLEHRVVMAEAIGRNLITDEHVHHINGDRADNRLKNLMLLTNAEHQKLHDHPQTRSRRVTLSCKRCNASYERRQSKVNESNFCSNKCKLKSMHEGNRKQAISEL